MKIWIDKTKTKIEMENTIIKEHEAVHCKTEEEAKEVLAIADKLGLRWSGGRS